MAKNMIRKSLAAGAGFALVATGLVAAPAQAAATSLEISPLLGSGYDTVLGATFNLKVKHVGGADDEAFSVFIDGATAASVTAYSDNDGHAASYTAIPSGMTDAVTATAVSNAAKTAVLEDADLDLKAGKYTILSISLDDSVVTTTTSITVTPFKDTVLADDKIGSDEVSGNSVTITFHKASEVTATVSTLTPAPIAANSGSIYTTALVTLDKGVNMVDTVGGVGKVQFKENGGTATNDTTVPYSIADGAYKAQVASNDSNVGNFADGDVVSAQAFVEGEAVGGPVALAGIAGGGVASLSAFSVAAGTSYLAADGSTNDAVRAKAGTIVVSTVVTAESTYSKAGQPVTFKIAETSDGSIDAATITAGGKSLTDATASTVDYIEVVAISNAAGKASVEIAYSGLDAGETFDVSASGIGADLATVAARTFTATDSAAKVVVSNVDGGDGAAASYSLVKGSAGSVTFFIRDQYGQVPVGNFRANASISGGSMAALNSTITFVSGQATLSWTDNNSAANNAVTIALDVEKQNLDTTWSDTSETYTAVLVDVLAAAATPSRVTATNTTNDDGTVSPNEVILKEDYVTGDERWEQSSKAWNTDATIDDYIEGVVYSTTGGAMPGASVTVSAPGVLFTNEAKTVYSADSITVTTARDGGYKVYYASNTVGTKTFSVTSGSVSAAASTAKFDGVSETDAVAISITAPDTVAAGSTVTAVATVVDQFGNPVAINAQSGTDPEVTFTYSGPGLIVGTNPVVSSSATGEMKVQVLLGSNESGTATVTATFDYDGDGDLTEVDGGNFSVAKTITIGSVAAGDLATWTKKLTDGSAKMYAKNIVGEGKVQFMLNGEEIAWVRAVDATDPKLREANGSYYLVRTVEFVEGQKNVLEIYVDGVRTTRTAYTY